MTEEPGRRFAVEDSSAAGEARRAARAFAERLGLEADAVARVAIGVTEMVTNILKHAKVGQLVLMPVTHEPRPALAVLALDRGPGIADLDRSMRDGVSSQGTSGTGLGAIRRQAEELGIHAPVGKGAAVLALFRNRGGAPVAAPPAALPFRLGALRLPHPSEMVCGDAWAAAPTAAGAAILLADGLGHGLLALEAADEAVRTFRADPSLAPGDLLERADRAMRKTRGAAVSIASANRAERTLSFAGVGNVSGALVTGFGYQGLMCHGGIVGHEMRKVAANVYPWPAESALVLFSDGLGTRWRPEQYPGLLACHPLLTAGVLLRDHRRERDDVTVIVARWAA